MSWRLACHYPTKTFIVYSMNLFDLKAAQEAEVLKINLSGGAAERLSSLGITAGKRVTVLAFSLFKSSVLIGCGSVRVGVRKNMAKSIEVKQ